jgi:CBS domain-containing protein
MTPNPICVATTAPLSEVARVMREADTGAVPVCEGERPSASSPIATSSSARYQTTSTHGE